MKKISDHLPRLALAGSLVYSLTAIAAPAILSAVKTSNVITIYGSGFGTKATAAPTFFQPFTATTTGDTPFDAGFDTWNDHGGEAVDMTQGVGGGSLMMDLGTAVNAMPHVGVFLPANTSDVTLNFMFRVFRDGTGADFQVKGPRAGVGGHTGDPAEDYAANPKFWTENFSANDGDCYQSTNFRWTVEDGTDTTTHNWDSTGQGVNWVDHWVNMEVRYKFNDYGVANGIMRVAIDGVEWTNITDAQPRTDPSEYIEYIQPIPGIDSEHGFNDYRYAISRVYIDSGADSQARVYLCNTSTAAACTKKFLLPPTTWTSGTDITVTAENIPTGYSWLYVSNAAGEVNSAGYAYTGC